MVYMCITLVVTIPNIAFGVAIWMFFLRHTQVKRLSEWNERWIEILSWTLSRWFITLARQVLKGKWGQVLKEKYWKKSQDRRERNDEETTSSGTVNSCVAFETNWPFLLSGERIRSYWRNRAQSAHQKCFGLIYHQPSKGANATCLRFWPHPTFQSISPRTINEISISQLLCVITRNTVISIIAQYWLLTVDAQLQQQV